MPGFTNRGCLTAMSDERTNNSPGIDQQREIAKHWVIAQPTISAYIWSCIRDFHAAEDVLQEVAQDAAASFSRYDPEKSFVAWALGIARFKVIDFHRNHRNVPQLFDNETLDEMCEAFAETNPEASPQREALDFCLDRLQGKSRQAIEMRYELNMKPAKIAERIGSTSGSVRVMLTRIRNALSDCVEARMQRTEREAYDRSN